MPTRYRARITALVRKFGVPEDDVDDVVQQVFEQAFLAWHQCRSQINPRAWLGSIALRVVHNRTAAAVRLPIPFSSLPVGDDQLPPDVDEVGTESHDPVYAQVAARDTLRLTIQALDDLNPSEKSAFTLRVLLGLSPSVAARHAEVRTVTSHVRYARSRNSMKRRLNE